MGLGIDLGTATTVVSDVRRGVVFDEPSVMLLRRDGGRRERVLAVGQEAADLLGRAPPDRFTALRPLDDGVVTDLEKTRLYLRSILHKAGRRVWELPVRAVIGVPVGSTSLQRRSLLEAADEAGISPETASQWTAAASQ